MPLRCYDIGERWGEPPPPQNRMDYIDDPALMQDIEGFSSDLDPSLRELFMGLISRAVEAGMDAQERMSNPNDLRYFVG